MTHVENFWSYNCNISSVLSIFKYNPDKTNNKFVNININIIVYGLVTRYGPWTSCQRI